MNRAPDQVRPCHLEDRPQENDAPAGIAAQSLWQWIAVSLLVLCWIAEAAMCADRGY